MEVSGRSEPRPLRFARAAFRRDRDHMQHSQASTMPIRASDRFAGIGPIRFITLSQRCPALKSRVRRERASPAPGRCPLQIQRDETEG
jgi:hypothetical protein